MSMNESSSTYSGHVVRGGQHPAIQERAISGKVISGTKVVCWLARASAYVLLCVMALPVMAAEGVKVRAQPQFASVVQGGRLVIAVEMDHQEHFHTWPAAEVALPKDVDEFAIRTLIGPVRNDRDEPSLPTWVSGYDGTQYPKAEVGKAPDPSGANPTIDVPLYMGKAAAYVRLNVAAGAALGEQTIEIGVTYQACNESMCLPPEDVVIPVKVRVVASGAPVEATSGQSALFAGYDAGKWGAGGGGGSDARSPASETKGATAPTNSQGGSASGATASAGATLFGFKLGTGAVLVFLASAVGGCLLNLTPCVLPVIPIKVLTLTKHGTSRRQAIVLGLWMFAGVVAFWSVIGIPMALISASLDPTQFIFGIWWVTMSIGLVIAVLALGIMGLFTINLPQSVYAVEAEADSPIGSFFFGVLTAVLGLPCFGFVAGSLLAAAATMPTLTIMSIFVGIGVGMGLPYLVLSAYPQLLKFMPRTGPASELVKQVMGLLLFAAAAFFITAAIKGLLKEHPYLAGSITWWAVGFFVAIAGVWLIIRTMQISKSVWPRVVMPVIAVAGTLGIGVFARHEFRNDKRNYEERMAALRESASPMAGDVPPGVWFDYSPERFAALRAANRPVFLDFTADWCITCKALKAAVLDTQEMRRAFVSRDIVLMEVDTTVRSGLGAMKLKELGRTGVPTWAVFAPGSDKPRFLTVETPTVNQVLAELDQAGVRPTAVGMKR